MRADRLVSALLVLQAKGNITAAELARELEVSVRTARRDLESLSMSGIPVYPQPGRGGGWRLLGGAKTDLTGLTGPETQALFLAIGASAANTPALGAAMNKLAQALPEPFRDQAKAASSAVVVDMARWGRPNPEVNPQFLEPLQQAIVGGWQIRLGYAGPRKPASTRIVHPLGLATKAGLWYLIAAPEHHKENDKPRTFRVSRMTSVEQLSQPVRRPVDFDLETSWLATTESFKTVQNPIEASAMAEPWTLPILRHVLGHRLQIGGQRDDDRLMVEITGATSEALAGELAGFGTGLEFLSPESVLTELGKIGQQLTQLYP